MRKDSQLVMTFRAVTEDILQVVGGAFIIHKSDFLRHQRSWCRTGRGGGHSEGWKQKEKKQAEEGKVQATLGQTASVHINSEHSSFSLLLSISSTSFHLSLCCPFSIILCASLALLNFSQNDDGPDVRAGSGDILLVHATETDRKGIVQNTLRLVLGFVYLLCAVVCYLASGSPEQLCFASVTDLQSFYIQRQIYLY